MGIASKEGLWSLESQEVSFQPDLLRKKGICQIMAIIFHLLLYSSVAIFKG